MMPRLLFILTLAVASLAVCSPPALAGGDTVSQSRKKAWEPSFNLAEVTRFHVPISVGARFGYPQSLASIAARAGVDLWLGRLGIEAGGKFAFAFGQEITAEPPTYFRMLGRVGAKGIITLKGPNPSTKGWANGFTRTFGMNELNLAIGGGFSGGGVSVNHSDLKGTLGAYEFIEFLLGPSLLGSAAKTGDAGYMGIRVEQEQLFHPGLDWIEHSTTILFTASFIGKGGRTPYFH